MGELVVGLDIGTTKVAALVGNVLEGGTIEIIGRGLAPSHGLEKGVVVDIGETTASIRRAVEQAEKMADVKIQSVTVGIAGRHIKSINNSGTVSINRDNRIITREDVRRVIETAQAVQIPPDNQLIHVIPRQYIVDGQDGITDPIGMTGMRLEVDVHIVTGAITAVHNIVRCVQNMGIGIEHIVLQPLASSYAVLTSAEKELGVALLDIGGGTTDIAIFRGGDIWFSKILPIAGEHITNDITVGLKVPYEEAERIK
ncbi:MAG: cell division protein FtsA, partial [Candidatus Bipolaricaulia bacterium]